MKILFLIIYIFCFPLLAMAGFEHAPASFLAPEGQVIFIDFKSAEYFVTYDAKTKTASAVSKITFENISEGLPAFDLVENPSKFLLDGETVLTKVINTADTETWLRIALKSIKPGTHTFEIVSPINENLLFTNEGVVSAFWFTDLGDRAFLEAYLPANFEYDQFKIMMHLNFTTLTKQKIFTNGSVSDKGNNHFKIQFPETYTSSSLYFHTAPIGRYPEVNFIFPSIDGRNLPVTAYSGNPLNMKIDLEVTKTKVLESLNGLETKFGPFPHQKIIIFVGGGGGMEYCGATVTDLWSLNHELTHSYFARGGFMPANGNAGWIDEAITTWSDLGSGTLDDLRGQGANMAGNSPYRRYTHPDAYYTGKNFMAHLNYKFQSSGGLNSYLAQMVKDEAFRPMTTEEFIKKISHYYSEDLSVLFKKHTYTTGNAKVKVLKRPAHMKLTLKELRKLL